MVIDFRGSQELLAMAQNAKLMGRILTDEELDKIEARADADAAYAIVPTIVCSDQGYVLGKHFFTKCVAFL